ncbi:MAG: glycosyltransferase [Actinomycetota bacterium]
MQLIVLGMHRSGTSSVTRLLNLAGAYFGPEGIATDPNAENPKGFWERRDVRQVCDGLLLGGGFDWWRIADFAPDRIPEAARAEQTDNFNRIVHQLDAHRPWVMKEPRLCLLMPLLRPALEAPVFIHVTREPLEIAESLAARNGFSVPVGLAMWEAYTLGALAASSDQPRAHVSYGELMADPVGVTTRLVTRLEDLGVQGLRVPSEREVTSFITPDLHRQREHSENRRGYLNASQLLLAEMLDEGGLPDGAQVPSLSGGAVAALRAFERAQAVTAELTELRLETEAERERAAVEAAAEAAAHQRALDKLRSEQRERDKSHEQREHELRADAADAARATRDAELQAVEALDLAARKVRSARRSGVVRIGRRLAPIRALLRGGSTAGVDDALQSALKRIDEARTGLHGHLGLLRPEGIDALPEVMAADELRLHRGAARARGERAKVAVLAWDVGHNPFGRAHLLADLLRERFDVEIWGSQFERYGASVWSPLRETTIPVRRAPGSSFPDYLDTMEDLAQRIDADAIYVSKPRLPSLAVGILAKERWNRPLVVDIDDFEPSFFGESAGLAADDIRALRGNDDLTLPFGRLWTQACEHAVRSADQLTVSNLELEAHYGGAIVPHARDEARFDPARCDRALTRQRLGLSDADRLILFGGTPRAHKGILDILKALDRLGDRTIRLGVFASRELDELRREMGALERWVLPLPSPAFDDLPDLLAGADLTCALQTHGHPVSRFQMPAKVTDAMAMGVPCLVTPVPPLQALIDKDVLEVFDGEIPLEERIREVLGNVDETTERAMRAREVFLESYSYAAVRPLAVAAIERYMDDPPPLAKPLADLVTTTRDLFRPGGGELAPSVKTPPRDGRRALPAGAIYDLVVFWKQNDTGIYGRRQDMMLKYLERSGRFHTIIHFDKPMSAKGLAEVARRSLGSSDQNGLVLRQTMRRLAGRGDRGALKQRTFLYGTGGRSRSLGLPRRDGYVDYVRAQLRKEGVGAGRRPLMCLVYPTNSWFPEIAEAISPDVVVADVVDDNRSWYAPGTAAYDDLNDNYERVLAWSDVVLANCEPVAESMRAFTPRVEVLPNACELPIDARPHPRPAELRHLGSPIIGYAGNLSDRIDLHLLRQLIAARPEWSFVFLGSTHLDRSALQLAGQPNVTFIGTRRHEQAQEIIRHFDVALIPHLDNEMTRSMNPLKAYVYCSLGVPIVSTPVANLDELSEYISVADGPDEFLEAIEAALSTEHGIPDREALIPHSWEARVSRVLELVDAEVTGRRDDEG